MNNPSRNDRQDQTEHQIAHARENDAIRRAFAFLMRHKWALLASTITGSVLALVYLNTQSPIYESDATLIVSESSPRNPIGESELGGLLQATYGLGLASTIDDELHRLRSRSFSMELAAKILRNRTMGDGRQYPLLWRAFPTDSSVVGIDTLYTRIMDQFAVNRLDQRSNAIRLTFSAYSPLEAAEVVDMALETYEELSLQNNRAQARSAMEFLSGELERVELNLMRSEESIRRFMNENALIQLDAQAEDLVLSLSQLETDRYSLETRLASAEQTIALYTEEVERISPGLTEQLTSALSPRIDQLQFMMAEKQTQRTLLLSRNPELVGRTDNPTLLELDRQIQGLQVDIESLSLQLMDSERMYLSTAEETVSDRYIELRNQILGLQIEQRQLQTQLESLNGEIERRKEQFDELPDEMIELARYRRQLQMNESIYLLIAQQAAETALWEQTQGSVARIIDRPLVASKPVSPRRNVTLLAGSLIGFLLCFGFILVWESTRSVLSGLREMSDRNLPLLTVIPDTDSLLKEQFGKVDEAEVGGYRVKTTLFTLLDPISHVTEAYRRLQSNLLFSQPDQPMKSILITSAGKSEGKTTVSGNLAISLAEAGRTVLLVDADHRKPSLHRMFGVDLEPGTSDVLFNHTTLEQAIRPTPVEGVHLLTTGRLVPNPAEISRSRAFHDLLTEAAGTYDTVVVDTAPLGIISDASSLLGVVNGVVLIARFGQTKLPEFDQVLSTLRQFNANVAGAVITAFDPRKSNASDYYSPTYAYYNHENVYKSYGEEIKS